MDQDVDQVKAQDMDQDMDQDVDQVNAQDKDQKMDQDKGQIVIMIWIMV